MKTVAAAEATQDPERMTKLALRSANLLRKAMKRRTIWCCHFTPPYTVLSEMSRNFCGTQTGEMIKLGRFSKWQEANREAAARARVRRKVDKLIKDMGLSETGTAGDGSDQAGEREDRRSTES